jgi:hypothetical protein
VLTDKLKGKMGKAILTINRGGPWDCEMSRLPHFLDNWLKDGGEIVILTRRPMYNPQEDSWYSFLLEAELTTGSQRGWKDSIN